MYRRTIRGDNFHTINPFIFFTLKRDTMKIEDLLNYQEPGLSSSKNPLGTEVEPPSYVCAKLI